jgi:glyoxylase-like metal-dependent hydrolase (beta-lactamase superfamily II)
MVGSLTTLPVLVVPSHLHFDHIGRAAEFDTVALPDRRDLRVVHTPGHTPRSISLIDRAPRTLPAARGDPRSSGMARHLPRRGVV